MNHIKEAVHARLVYQLGYTGKNITIAILDTGISPHPDLIHRQIVFCDFVHGREDMYDDNGHGTHVAGIICGDGAASGQRLTGIAPRANLVVLKVLDRNGNGETEDVIAAIEWLKHNYAKYQIKLLNFSVGFLPNSDVTEQKKLLDAIEELWDMGMMVVAAAGNNGPRPTSITVPGISRKILTIGASDDGVKGIAGSQIQNNYSGKGPTNCCIVKPEILAPGTKILSCDNKKNGYVYKSGTSMSAPIVCGALALGMERYPDVSPEEWKLRLYETAWPRGEMIHKKCWGILNVDKLIQMN